MEKSKKAVMGFLAIVSVVGIVLGPASWYSSHSFYSEFHTLEANGKKAVATVDRVYESINYKYSIHTADVHFTDPSKNEIARIEEIEINALYQNVLKVNDQVDIWYLNDKAVIIDNYNSEYVPLIKKPYWGMILTIISIVFFVRMIAIVQRKKKELKQNT
ncbi:MAG: hypothetical protein ACJASQ_004314 [Crocinitomicaceae bacterium]|jgi:hypothetical protein